MLKNGQIYFKILWYKQRNIFKVYLAVFQQYAIKEVMNVMTVCNEYIQSKWHALHDLIPLVEFKRGGRHSWRSVTFREVI